MGSGIEGQQAVARDAAALPSAPTRDGRPSADQSAAGGEGVGGGAEFARRAARVRTTGWSCESVRVSSSAGIATGCAAWFRSVKLRR